MHPMRSICFVALFVALLPGASSGQWSTDPNVNTPVCTLSDASSMQTMQMCSDGAGGVIVVWGDKRKEKTNTGGDIYAQRLDVNGVPQWTTDGVMICDTTGEQNMPIIVSDGVGGAFIGWVDARTGQYTGNIYLQHINASGQKLWENQGKQITTGNAWFNPSICPDGAGGVFLAYRYGVTPAGIYAQRVGSDGTLLYAGNGVAVSQAGYNDNPTTAADDSGGVFISWIYTRGDGLWNGYIQRLTASGQKRYTANGVPFRAQAASQGRTQLASMGGGEVMAAWYDERAVTAVRVIYVQRFSWNGTPLLAAGGKPVTDATQDAYYLAMCKDGVGGVFITYLYGYTVRAIGLNGQGIARWDSSAGAVLCNAARERYFGGITLPEPGRAVVCWYDYRDYTYDVPDADIYAQTVDTLGQVGWAANGVPVGTAPRYQFAPVITPTTNGGVIAAFWDDRGGSGSYSSYRVYAQRIDAQGAPTQVSATFPMPEGIDLMQNYPNPFNPSTEIRYRIGKSGMVSLAVFDLMGRQVATLVREHKEAGQYVARFDGAGLASGVYFYRLESPGVAQTMRMMLVR
jgi:hypothetical protein